MSPTMLALRLVLVQGCLQLVLGFLARGLGRPLRREAIVLGLVLPWMVLAPWIRGPALLVPTSALAGQIPGTEREGGPDAHDAEQNDAVFQFIPWELEARHALAEGRLPLWSDLVDGGSSLWANLQACVLSPIAMLGRAFPIQHHLLATLAFKIMIMAQGAWVLARMAGARRSGAFVAAFSAGLCGGLMAWPVFAHSAVLAWVPWHCASVVLLFRRPSRWAIVLAAVLTTAVLLSGQPEVALAGGVFAAIYGIALRRKAARGRPGAGGAAEPGSIWRAHFARQLAVAALAAVLGVGLAAVVIVPFAAQLPDTIRTQEHLGPPPAPQPMELSRPATWFQYFKGGYFATPWNPHVHGRPFQEEFRGPIGWALAEAPYAGLVALVGALVGVALGKPATRILVVFSAIVILLATSFIPLQNILHLVPLFRVPEYGRFLPVMSLALALAGGLGADAFLGRRSRLLAGCILAAAGIVSLLLTADGHVATLWALLAAAFAGTVIGARSRRLARVARWAALGLLVVALTWDLVPWGRALLPRGEARRFYPVTREMETVAALVASGGPWRATAQDFLAYPSVLPVYGFAEPRTHNPMARADVVRALTAAFGFAPSNDPYFSPLRNLGHPLLDFLNVRAVISNRYLPVPPGMDSDPRVTGLWRVYSNPEALPRYFLATGADVVPRAGVQPWIAAMQDPRRVALLAEEAGDVPPSSRAWDAAAVTVLAARPGHIRLAVAGLASDAQGAAAAAPGTALLATSLPDPRGWHASAAGGELPGLTVNGAYFGTLLRAGTTEVTLRYRPPGFRAGLAISIAALVGLVLVAWWRPRRPA